MKRIQITPKSIETSCFILSKYFFATSIGKKWRFWSQKLRINVNIKKGIYTRRFPFFIFGNLMSLSTLWVLWTLENLPNKQNLQFLCIRIFRARKRSCGKVMFSQACDILSRGITPRITPPSPKPQK